MGGNNVNGCRSSSGVCNVACPRRSSKSSRLNHLLCLLSSTDMVLDLVSRYLEGDAPNTTLSAEVSTTNKEQHEIAEEGTLVINIRGTSDTFELVCDSPVKASSLGASIGRSSLVKSLVITCLRESHLLAAFCSGLALSSSSSIEYIGLSGNCIGALLTMTELNTFIRRSCAWLSNVSISPIAKIGEEEFTAIVRSTAPPPGQSSKFEAVYAFSNLHAGAIGLLSRESNEVVLGITDDCCIFAAFSGLPMKIILTLECEEELECLLVSGRNDMPPADVKLVCKSPGGIELLCHVIEVFYSRPNLVTSFTIKGYSIISLAKIIPQTERFSSLRNLDLSNNGIGDSARSIPFYHTLESLLDKCPHLEVLSLGGNQISDDGIELLLEDKGLRGLKVLDLAGNSISLTGLRVLATALGEEGCALESLYLDGILIDDRGAEVLAGGLRGSSRLEELTFRSGGALVEGERQGMWQHFKDLLCDASSREATCMSNHVLKYLGTRGICPSPEVESLLQINRDGSVSAPGSSPGVLAATKKMLECHGGYDVSCLAARFCRDGLRAVPDILEGHSWFASRRFFPHSAELDIERTSVAYQLVREHPKLAVASLAVHKLERLSIEEDVIRIRLGVLERQVASEKEKLEQVHSRVREMKVLGQVPAATC